MPADSHARMNLDTPYSGSYFEFACCAAFKVPISAFENIVEHIKQLDDGYKRLTRFMDK